MKRSLKRHMVALFLAVLSYGANGQAMERTYIGDLALYAKGGIRIIVSGDETKEFAQRLKSELLQSPYYAKAHSNGENVFEPTLPAKTQKGPFGLSIQEMTQTFNDSPVVTKVFLLIGQESPSPLPSHLQAMMPFEVQDMAAKVSFISASATTKPPAFSMYLYAPDKERFAKLFNIFRGKSFQDVNGYPWKAAYKSNKVALFSTPELKGLVSDWGKETEPNTWNDIEWHSLDERATLAAEDLTERHQAYFFDRSQPNTPPASLEPELKEQTIEPNTLFIKRAATPEKYALVIFSAPNRTLLEARLQRFPNFKNLLPGPTVEAATDLRRVGRAPLLISGVDDNAGRETLQLKLASAMRQTLNMDVMERGKILQFLQQEVTLQQLQGATDTAKKMRDAGAQYVWHFAVTRLEGATGYVCADAECTPRRPTAFVEAEPTVPKKPWPGAPTREYAIYDAKVTKFNSEYSSWQQKKRDFENDWQNTDVRWERRVSRNETASAEGFLRLLDLQQSGKVIWETECRGNAGEVSFVNTDRETVRGFDSQPRFRPLPDSERRCTPSILWSAGEKAGRSGLQKLRETAWLAAPGEVLSAQPTTVADNDNAVAQSALVASTPPNDVVEPPQPAPPSKPQVAAMIDDVIVITAGENEGVNVGDKVTVALKTVEITNPTTKEVIDHRVTETLILRVVKVGKTADCMVIAPADKELLKTVKAGMEVTIETPAPEPETTTAYPIGTVTPSQPVEPTPPPTPSAPAPKTPSPKTPAPKAPQKAPTPKTPAKPAAVPKK